MTDSEINAMYYQYLAEQLRDLDLTGNAEAILTREKWLGWLREQGLLPPRS